MAHSRPQLSLLVPFRASVSSPHRARAWAWLEQYWSYELPDAEIVIGVSTREPFSKTEAVNDAASRASGRIFVILDSDAYITGDAILECARAIEQAARRRQERWYIPYRRLYRLTEAATDYALSSDPKWPFRFALPPAGSDVESHTSASYGHQYGAMAQILPREAFEVVGGMDTRFEGWGGEDVAFVRAVDTLFAKHKTLNADIFHFWHPTIGSSAFDKMWPGQDRPGVNNRLANRYYKAFGDVDAMQALVNEVEKKT